MVVTERMQEPEMSYSTRDSKKIGIYDQVKHLAVFGVEPRMPELLENSYAA